MEYHKKHRFGPAISSFLKTLLVFVTLLTTLRISCLFYKRECPLCFRFPTSQVFEAEPAKIVPTFINVGIYAFSAADPSSALSAVNGGIMRDDAFKPLYNSKYLNNEHLLVSNVKLTKLWTSKEWRSKVSIFTDIFSVIVKKQLLKPCGKVLCIGAGKGHEVLALKEMGVYNSIGIDLVASPPLVMKGDMHSQPFGKDTFDFEFSNVFDHALFSSMFAAEIERTLKPGGYVAIHFMLKNPQGYKPNNLQKVDVLIELFQNFEVVHVGDIDAFGLDTEVIFKKPMLTQIHNVKGSPLAHE